MRDFALCQLEGEDLGAKDREKAQREQQRQWALQQMKEKQNRKRLEDAQNRYYYYFSFIYFPFFIVFLLDWKNYNKSKSQNESLSWMRKKLWIVN